MKLEPNEFDKSTWGSGPWQDEPDLVEFRAHGLPCVLRRNRSGAWCGYVGVPSEHPDARKGYRDLDLEVDVHGGMTYAEPCNEVACHIPAEGEADTFYWFGFDCAHPFDLKPRARGLLHPDLWDRPSEEDIYRDVAYARGETESLAEQLAQRAR